jgi:hypothetical protein
MFVVKDFLLVEVALDQDSDFLALQTHQGLRPPQLSSVL